MKRFTLVFIFLIWICSSGCQNVVKHPIEKPLIGINMVYDEKRNNSSVDLAYVEAVLESGGIPLVLPTIKEQETIDSYVEMLDGLVLVGGRDIPPEMYGQTPHRTVRVLPERRTSFDSLLIAQWMESKKPILGICLGMQFTNVVFGGSMIQDIPSLVGRDVNHYRNYHRVTIEQDSILAEILKSDTAMVYSSHHQAVDRIGEGLQPIAYSDDGMVEALQRTDGGLGLFVQWHPEAMTEKYPDHTQALFGYLADMCVK